MSNEVQIWKNLTKESVYATLPNGGIINLKQYMAYSFTAGVAYATSGYIALGLLESSFTPTPEEIEVIVLTQELKHLAQEFRDLGNKFDAKMDNFDKKFELKFDKIDTKMESHNKDLDIKLDRLEAKLDKTFDKLTEMSNKLSEKVTVINTDVAVIKASLETKKTWKEKLQMPIITGLIVASFIVIANHLSSILKALVGVP